MFRAPLTISKIACEKNAQHALGVFHCAAQYFRRLRVKKSRRSQSIWLLAISQRYACRNKGRVGISQFALR
ncbi:hypothetical protein ALO89_200019 [Pseudomonas coronafaciens pv. porri]|nr:hypothetical protein ALO89_200019 [Pseudomonas coronafaciens pv. porri]